MILYSNRSERALALEAAFVALGLHAGTAPDICVVLGGDGSMLRAIQKRGPRLAYFGINCGHLGFLMNELPGDPPMVAQAIARILETRAFQAKAFPRLLMSAQVEGGVRTARALNDVYVERQLGQTCHLRVTVDGVEVVGRMVCDGIVVATALGSTAYSFSAGGSAAHPLLRAIHLTAICPHTPRLAPLVLPVEAKVHVEVLDHRVRRARAVADGFPHEDVRAVDIATADDDVRLCFLEGHDFTTTMIRKILHP